MADKHSAPPPSRSEILAERAGAAYSSTVGKAAEAASAVGNNPAAALVGSLALGALVGAILPRSARERALLASTGQRLNAAARAALDAGREAGGEALAASGFGGEALQAQASRFFSEAGKAASAAGSAALNAARATDAAR